MKTRSAFCSFVAACWLNIAITANAQVNTNDSLALVDLYNSTNGPSWYHNNNWLSGPVSSWYGIQLTGNRVSFISLSNNNLSGTIPASIGNLSDLSDLYLDNNLLEGNIPPSLGNLINLAGISLNNNQLSGPIPPELGRLSNLYALRLNNNRLSGSIPPGLSGLISIYTLDVSNNLLSGNLPPELGMLSNLSFFSAANNQLSGIVPPELAGLSALFSLRLNNNELSGQIPPALGNLSDLASLYLNHNRLSGPIPPELGKLSNLYYLYLNDNQLSGHIPPGLGNLELLYDLHLHNNRLNGHIPGRLGKLTGLNSLRLSNNKLRGSLPEEIGNLQSLQYLFLDHNQLSGPVPASIATLLNLDSPDLSHNRFTFEGMEPIAAAFPSAKYGKQAPIPVKVKGNILSVSAGGTLSNNVYRWHKAGRPDKTTTIEGDSVFHPSESGLYYVRVSNKIATKLHLFSYPLWYSAQALADAVVSKQNFSNKQFSVYPNPVTDILHIRSNGNASFSLLSQRGQVLVTININTTGSIRVSNLPSGIYYLRNNNTNAAEKIYVNTPPGSPGID